MKSEKTHTRRGKTIWIIGLALVMSGFPAPVWSGDTTTGPTATNDPSQALIGIWRMEQLEANGSGNFDPNGGIEMEFGADGMLTMTIKDPAHGITVATPEFAKYKVAPPDDLSYVFPGGITERQKYTIQDGKLRLINAKHGITVLLRRIEKTAFETRTVDTNVVLDVMLDLKIDKLTSGGNLTGQEREDCQAAFIAYQTVLHKKYRTENRLDFPKEEILRHYVLAVRMSMIDSVRHAGWPFRHEARMSLFQPLRDILHTNSQPIYLAAVMVPALDNGDTQYAVQAYRTLQTTNAFMARHMQGLIENNYMKGSAYAREFSELVNVSTTTVSQVSGLSAWKPESIVGRWREDDGGREHVVTARKDEFIFKLATDGNESIPVGLEEAVKFRGTAHYWNYIGRERWQGMDDPNQAVWLREVGVRGGDADTLKMSHLDLFRSKEVLLKRVKASDVPAEAKQQEGI